MASELIVQTIQGPSSGANANKVLIPSGHTLDASEGFIPPAGSVVQVQYLNDKSRTQVTVASATYTDLGLSVSITPKYSNSLIQIRSSLLCYMAVNGTEGVRTLIARNGTFINDARDEDGGAHNMHYYSASVNNEHIRLVDDWIDTPSTTSQVTYSIYGSNYTGGSSAMNFFNGGLQYVHMSLTEIKQ